MTITLGIASVLLLIAAYYDLRTREIPDWIAVTLVVLALVAAALGWHPAGWTALLTGGGLGVGLGMLVFASGGMGGGDAKLCMALGALLGPLGLLSMMFWVAIAGGLLAVVAVWRGQRDLAYVPALTAGMWIYTVWPQGTARILGL